ncbi:MAG TPA: alpha/beta fold hydrolase [Streptosporangiaceae bacterium]|nr:alpha/beta fold hydrolase [Streptosporangiaceae bacterium]
MRVRWRPRGRFVIAAVAGVALLAVAITLGATTRQPVDVTVRNLRIGVVDGPRDNQHVVLDASLFTPAGQGRLPAILLAPGFGETKYAVAPEAEYLARAGFAVLTWSPRGTGASGGQIGLDSPDYEVRDTSQLVTWLARQPRVLLDRPGDPRVGITGASYGGGLALLAAAYDHRINAVVAQSAWHNLAAALFPNAAGGGPATGVFARQWAGLLFTQGSAGFGTPLRGPAGPAAAGSAGPEASPAGSAAAVRQHVLCGRFLPSICAMYQQAAQAGQATPAAISLLQRSSPASVASRMDAPALLIQGEHDSLFDLGQANANYQAIRRNGGPAAMVWFAGGHDGGDQQTGYVDSLTAAWFTRWLAPGHTPPASPSPFTAGTGQPGFAVTRVLGFDPSTDGVTLGTATAGSYPGLAGTTRTVVRLTGPPQAIGHPPGGAPPSLSGFPGLGALGAVAGGGTSGVTFDMPGQSAAFTSAPLSAALQVTGSPTVRIRVSGTPQVILFAKVYDVDQAGHATLPYQLVAPLRVTGTQAGRIVTVTLPAIDYSFSAGHRLRLVLTTTDFGYATPPAPAVYQVALAGSGLTVPGDPALTVTGGGAPGWVWAAPLCALAAAIGILALGWRRGRDTLVTVLAPVPLEISGLVKRYRDGQLAVDGLSLRVERGQILGLLGPNGAGKTTALRALMGLLHPDEGTITIFGHRVHPGSPALSRLGSFVEGPGFLPHLSGRANLELYWRATGRPAGGWHLDEVLALAGLGTAIDRPVRSYSRGMCQRLAIAQAMLGLPDLLVLDEPMNGLDPPQIREMRDALLGYAAAGRTVILSSHLLAEVEQTCSHVVVMNQGRRVAAGPVADIIGDGAALLVGTTEADRAVSVLRGLSGIDSVHTNADGVQVQPNGVPASAVVAALVGAGIPVDRIGPGRRLEDAFLALIDGTGNGPPEAAAQAEEATP